MFESTLSSLRFLQMSTTRSIAEAPPELQQKLENAGYETIDDIKEAGILQVIQGEPSSSTHMWIPPFPTSQVSFCLAYSRVFSYQLELQLSSSEVTVMLSLVQGGEWMI